MSAGDLELAGDDRLAAEYALGLLEGEELLATRGRIAREPAFAGLVAQWEKRLAPLLDEIAGAAPSPELWARIEAEVERASQETSPVVALQRKLVVWQRVAAGSAVAAIAAVALLLVGPGTGIAPSPAPLGDPAATDQPPLAASIPIADTPLRIGVTFLPGRDELLVDADGLVADGIHDHELWLLPDAAGARPQSLGLVVPGEQRRVAVDPAAARAMEAGAQILVSREPLGGAPDKSAPGPVVAQGTLQKT